MPVQHTDLVPAGGAVMREAAVVRGMGMVGRVSRLMVAVMDGAVMPAMRLRGRR